MKLLQLGLCAIAALGHAEHLGVEITGSAQPNCSSVQRIVEGVTKGLTSDREKALALHRFGMAHLIHYNGPIEQKDLYITDPLKLVGVYGYALCGNNSAAMNGLYNAAGLKSRVRWLENHVVPEVWFENRWNYLDTDMFGYVFLDDGKTIASVDDVTRDADLFVRQRRPPTPFFPFDKKADMASVFRNAYNRKNYHAYSDAHVMRLGLRTGESVRMFYRPQNRFYMREGLPENLGIVYRDYWTEGAVRKGSLAWTDESPATYGNALFEYRPNLRSKAFLAENGLTAWPGSTGSVSLEVNTPWVIAGLQNDLSNFDDNSDGAVISGEFWRLKPDDENTISISTDNGRTWRQVWKNRLLGAIPFQVDVTRWVEGYSSYRVKFDWKGSGRVGLTELAVRTWTQLSPMALPRLVPGTNTFQLTTAPEKAVYNNSRWDTGLGLPGETLANLVASKEAPYLRIVDAAKPGVLTFPLGPMSIAKEARVSILASSKHPAGIAVGLSISEDRGKSWRALRQFKAHPEQEEQQVWFNHIIAGARVNGSEALLRVEVMGGGLEQVIANSIIEAAPTATGTLRVTHVWKEGEADRKATRDVKSGAFYEVVTGPGRLRNRELLIQAVAQ